MVSRLSCVILGLLPLLATAATFPVNGAWKDADGDTATTFEQEATGTLSLSLGSGDINACETKPAAADITMLPNDAGIVFDTPSVDGTNLVFGFTISGGATAGNYDITIAASATVCSSETSDQFDSTITVVAPTVSPSPSAAVTAAATATPTASSTASGSAPASASPSASAPASMSPSASAPASISPSASAAPSPGPLIPTLSVSIGSTVASGQGLFASVNVKAGDALVITLTPPSGKTFAGSTASFAHTLVFESWSPLLPAPTLSYGASSTTYTISAVALAATVGGVFKLKLNPGLPLSGSAVSVTANVEFSFGMPAIIQNPLSGAFFPAIQGNSTHITYSVAGAYANIVQSYQPATVPSFNALFASLKRLGSTIDLLPSLTITAGSSSVNSTVSYNIDISGLAEGTFVLARNASTELLDADGDAPLASQSVVIIIDRTAPVAVDSILTTPIVSGGNPASFGIPAGMFVDAVSATADLQITGFSIVNGAGAGIQQTFPAAGLPALVTVATFGADVVSFTSTAKFLVSVADAAGNIASAYLTVPIVAAPVVSLVVADARQSYTTDLTTGSAASLTSGRLVLTVIASCSSPMTGLSATSLTVTGGAAPWAQSTAASNNGYTWTFQFTVNATQGATYAISLARGKGARVSDGVANLASNGVSATIDMTTPFAALETLSAATLSAEYFAYINLGDSFNSNGTVIVSGTADVSAGLTVTAGPAGRAYIAGTPRTLPSSRATLCGTSTWVVFTLSIADAAGNTGVATACVKIISTTPAVTLTFATSTISFAEGAAAATLSAAATVSLAVDKIVVELDVASGSREAAEVLIATNPAAGSYALTTFGSTATGIGALQLEDTSGASISVANAQTFLRSVQYQNTATRANPGLRFVRISLYKNVSNTERRQTSYASKQISYTVVNSAPVATATIGATFTEQSHYTTGVSIASGVSITDADDDYASSATLTIATTASAGNYAACDGARDYLNLASDYATPAPVTGTWSAATCTLTLLPSTGTAVNYTDLASAIAQVKYFNADEKNPTNYVTTTDGRKRSISLLVTDNKSNGNTAASAASTAVTGLVTITLVDDAPIINWAAFYSTISTSTSQTANTVRFRAPDNVDYLVRKIPIAYNSTDTVTATFNIPLTLTATDTNGRFAGGAIIDPDTATPITSGSIITLSLVQVYANNGSYAAATFNGITLGNSDLSTVTNPSFDGTATVYFNINVNPAAANAYVGPFGVKLTYGSSGPVGIILFDARILHCLDANFSAAIHLASAAACGPAIPTVVNASEGTTLNIAGYDVKQTALVTLKASYLAAGLSVEEQVVAAAEQRAASRGPYSVDVAANAFGASGGSIQLTAVVVPDDVSLPALGTNQQADAGVTLVLGPACQQFNIPVRICVFVGDTGASYKRAMRISSLLDCRDATKGYGPWETMQNATFDPVTGEVCGETTHFSIISPILVPIPTSNTVDKTIMMGGSCPNDCSGRGYCRQEGKCACFAGFGGNDCSERACPSADSWDVSDDIVHNAAVCSNRGNCDTRSGACKCFAGFEGAACQRTSCPAGCSGHGRCRAMSDLPAVQGAQYDSWEAKRLQVCVCDGGYAGVDCSERLCPFGDDPETICSANQRQIQKITLDFGLALPPLGVLVGEELSLIFQHADGSNYSTPSAGSIFTANTGATNLAKSLKSLPAFAISDVSVSNTVTATKAEYAITFDGASLAFTLNALAKARLTSAGNTVPGNQNLFMCPADEYGSLGCTAPGCRPLYAQLRYLLQSAAAVVSVSSSAILQQPAGTAVAAEWGVAVTIIISATGTYSVSSTVYGVAGLAIAEQPLPPVSLRQNVPLVYGLVVDFNAATTGTYYIKWRLPTCAVTEVQPAGVGFEQLECSRRGQCDRKLGACKCFQGYSGANCGSQSIVV